MHEEGAECCDESVCLSVCLSVGSHILETTRLNLTEFLCMLPVAVAWFSSDGIEIRCVLPVLWMTSCGA